jgi:hypothetical protein
MTDEKLRDILEQLHSELERTDSVDDKEREILNHLSTDIQKFLDPDEDDDESLLERLQDAIDHFEVEHPTITAALSHM